MSLLKLPSTILGGREIRYIQFQSPNCFGTYAVPQSSDLTLFVASDVLVGSTQHANNHARIHARFAKEGFATRATLQGVRLAGTRNSSVMWFYSVVGLFKVVFEYLPLNVQRDCLQLKALWLTQSKETHQLPDKITLDHSNGHDRRENVTTKHNLGGSELVSLRCDNHIHDIQEDHQDTEGNIPVLDTPKQGRSDYTYLSSCNESVAMPVIPDKTLSVDRKVIEHTSPSQSLGTINWHHLPVMSDESRAFGTHDSDEADNGERLSTHHLNGSEISEESDMMNSLANETEEEFIVFVADSPAQEPMKPQQNCPCFCTDKLSNVIDILNYIQSFIRSKLPLYTSNSKDCLLLTRLITAVDYYCQECLDENSDGACNILEKIMLRHVELKKESVIKGKSDNFGLSQCTHTVLCAVSECLGQAYNSLAVAIMQRVEQFKKDHIGHIDELPSPHSLVNQLFPQCMQELLIQWMGPHGTGYPEDHSYSTPEKKLKRGKDHEVEKLYPFIQLILEFTNNALITGVAHVLYTRLLQDNSME